MLVISMLKYILLFSYSFVRGNNKFISFFHCNQLYDTNKEMHIILVLVLKLCFTTGHAFAMTCFQKSSSLL